MVPLFEPEIIFTHESDLDGFVSSLLLKNLAAHLYNVDVPIKAYGYDNWKNRAMNEHRAWVCDLGPDARIDKTNWLIVDHHQLTYQPKKAQLVHDTSKSAGSLCFDLCRSNGLDVDKWERLAELNNIADLFLQDSPDFVEACDYASLIKTYRFWNIFKLINGNLDKLIDHPLLDVIQAKRRIEDPIGLEWSRNHITRISSRIGFVATCVGNTNWLINQLLKSKDVPYAVLMTMFRKSPGPVSVSFRSQNGEALQCAETLKGGGHPNACGANLPRSIKTLLEAVDYLRQIFEVPLDLNTSTDSLESIFSDLD
jgi:oligoribonuclease NrnB/cAMP/cGMP phosphodiesterase (DHH superfamily)